MSARPSILAVIPARFGARRFPGKPLADLAGRPIVQWVHDAASSSPAIDEVVVATDDQRIADVVRGFGGAVAMTRSDHPTGSDRVAEVAAGRPDVDVVVNVQGDQPFATDAALSALVSPYVAGARPDMTTVACPLPGPEALEDPHTVKVVTAVNGDALYFSRSAIPYGTDDALGLARQHVGLYAFTRDTVLRFPQLPPTPLSEQENLEQLRALEHGIGIRVVGIEQAIIEVNTPEDLERARAFAATL